MQSFAKQNQVLERTTNNDIKPVGLSGKQLATARTETRRAYSAVN